jgi:hypothetical protein
MDVTTVNVLKEDCPYPDDYGPLSVLSGLPWGVRTNGEIVSAYLREQCALVVGPTGSGKTNMVRTILAGFARAQDVLTWVIDLNAGSAGLPWVLPALNGELTSQDGKPVRPGVDWLTSSYEEAALMLDAALAIGLHRKKAYQDLLAKANTDLLPISSKIPQILLVIDEGAEILVSTDRQMKQLAKKILEVIRMLRAMGIRTVLTALGGTGSVLGNLMIRREGKVRVALTGGETEGMDLGKRAPAGSRPARCRAYTEPPRATLGRVLRLHVLRGSTASGSHRSLPPRLRPAPPGMGHSATAGDPSTLRVSLDGQRRSARPARAQAPAQESGPHRADPARSREPAQVARHCVRRRPRRAAVPDATRRTHPGHRIRRGVGGSPRACSHTRSARITAREASI